MRTIFPFFWQPKGVVPSLADLPLSAEVPRKKDVTAAVAGSLAGAYPLIVAELAGGKIVGDLRLAATAGDLVIGDIQAIFGMDLVNGGHSLQRRRFRLPRRRAGTALLLGASNSDNYYHWLVDSLPRWPMLQAAGWREFDYVLLHSAPCAFQDETLDWVGVPPARRLRCSKNFLHQFDRLIVPSMPFARKTVPAWVAPWLRSLAPAGPGGPEKVYLSRRGTAARRLVNESEIEAALAARGFITLQPERLTVAEQARSLASARWIAGPHGGAMANMVFAPPGARVLEFFHPRHKNRCYANLAAAGGHRYASLEGGITRHDTAGRLEYQLAPAGVLEALGRLAQQA